MKSTHEDIEHSDAFLRNGGGGADSGWENITVNNDDGATQNDEIEMSMSPSVNTDDFSSGNNHNADRHRVLGTLPLAVLVFYSVSGGPWGIEPTVRAGGPLFALLGFLVLPLIWSIPESLVTAELGSTFPEASGTVAWIEEAFGTTAGFISGYLTWVSGATDNAIYPVLFLDYLLSFVNGGSELHMPPIQRFVMLSSTSVALAYINYRGIELVGNMSIVICIISMSPFVLLCILGAPKVDYHRWLKPPDTDVHDADTSDDDNNGWFYPTVGGVLWRPFLNNLFWNLNSFDSAACFAGEVKDPGRTFPMGMLLSVVMVMCSYFLPLLIAIGATESSQHDWKDGYITIVATNVGGKWLGAWTVFASGISNLALFQAEMTSDAFQIMGMANRGMLPRCLNRRSQYGTPTYGILLCTLVLVLMSIADFTHLVEMLNFNYAITLIMEYAAFVKLRWSRPNLVRPYKVPLNTFGCLLMSFPPVFLTLLVMAMASPITYLYSAMGCGIGAVIFVCHSVSSKRSCSTPTPADESTQLAPLVDPTETDSLGSGSKTK